MSLYGLDERTKGLLQLENFKGRFAAKQFVEQLSENHAGPSLEKNFGALDPKPYIRTFEAALNELRRLQDESKTRNTGISQQVVKAETDHGMNVVSLGTRVENIMADFGTLDATVNDIVGGTSGLYERLLKVSKQHDRALESRFLIRCYLSFERTNQCPELIELWKSTVSADKRRCANVVRQLQIIAKKVQGVGNSEAARDSIDKYAERLEKNLITDFDDAYRNAQLAEMKEAADTLTEFNGGASVVQVFINQHDFFIVQEKLVNNSKLDSREMWANLSDLDGDPSEFEQLVQEMMDEIRGVLDTESHIINQVFSQPVAVLKVFSQRVFAQRIQQQLESFLAAAEKESTLAYIRVLHISYSRMSSLVKDLKDITQNIDESGELQFLLDQNFLDIFIPYIDNNRYFDVEKRNLYELFTSLTAKFSTTHTQKGLNRENSLLASGGEKGRIGQFMRGLRLERSNSNHERRSLPPNDNDEETDEDSEVQVELVQRMLKATAEAVNRDLELVNPTLTPVHSHEFLELLLECLCRNYIDVGLELVHYSTSQEPKNEVNLNYFLQLTKLTISINLFSLLVKSVLLPMTTRNPAVQKSMASALNTYVTKSEEKISSIIQASIDLCLNNLAYILTKQKKKDFVIKDDLNPTETSTCEEASNFLDQVYKVGSQSLDGENLQQFLQEVGNGFLNQLLEHFKKFTVSLAGGLVVSKDIQRYQQSIDQWSLEHLSESFSILHSIGNLFTAQPSVLASLIRDSNLSRLKGYAVREYLSKRADYGSQAINRLAFPGSLSELRARSFQY